MTNTNKISRPQFLAFVLENMDMPGEYREVGETWYQKLTTKPKNDQPTKAQRENAETLERVADAIRAHGEPVTARWILENVAGILTIQKASSLARIGVKNGILTADTNKKVTEYNVA